MALPTMKSLPTSGAYRLAQARVPVSLLARRHHDRADFEGLVAVDLVIDAAGMIGAIEPASVEPDRDASDATPVIDLGGRVVMTAFAEIHAHIDKTQTWERAPNQDGSFQGAKAGAKSDRQTVWSYDDAYLRMNFALEAAFAHGTRSMRTHIDSQKKRTEPSWQVFDDLRRAWAGRLTLQGVVSLGVAKIMDGYGDEIADLAAHYGAAFGPVIYPTKTQKEEVARAFDLATTRGLALDFHVDETLDPAANGLEVIAREAIDRDFPHGIICGHNCALAMKAPNEIDRILSLVRDAGIGLTGLPMTNLYLQDRDPVQPPRWRGLMPFGAAVQKGIVCAAGGDNCRDAFHPFGDYDMLEVYKEAVKLGHLDNPPGRYAALITHGPETMMGLSETAEIRRGKRADLVIFSGRSLSQVFARPGAARMIVRAGRKIEAVLPEFLDR